MKRHLRFSPVQKTAVVALALLSMAASPPLAASNLVITGVVDGPLSGGLPKAIELCVLSDITDLSSYGIGSANNKFDIDSSRHTHSRKARGFEERHVH